MTEAEKYKEANELIEDIYKFKRDRCEGLGILEVIIEYSQRYEIPLQEIGNTLADHKEYVSILNNELAKEKYIKLDNEIYLEELDSEEW